MTVNGHTWCLTLTLPNFYNKKSHHPPGEAEGMGTLEASQFSPAGAWDGSTGQHLLAVPAPWNEVGQGTRLATESSVLAGADEHPPKQCLAMGWAQALPQAGCSVVPTLLWGGRGIEEGNQPSHRAAWPRAGARLPADSADWQGCSHQRPPTTYLKLSPFCKAFFFPTGEVRLCLAWI